MAKSRLNVEIDGRRLDRRQKRRTYLLQTPRETPRRYHLGGRVTNSATIPHEAIEKRGF
ncbi:MAG: hypothetical protein ACK4M3_04275 [Pyrobaculum sp.]